MRLQGDGTAVSSQLFTAQQSALLAVARLRRILLMFYYRIDIKHGKAGSARHRQSCFQSSRLGTCEWASIFTKWKRLTALTLKTRKSSRQAHVVQWMSRSVLFSLRGASQKREAELAFWMHMKAAVQASRMRFTEFAYRTRQTAKYPASGGALVLRTPLSFGSPPLSQGVAGLRVL